MLELEHCCISNCKLVLFAENNEFQEEETDLSNDICFLPSSLYFVLKNNDETFDVFFFSSEAVTLLIMRSTLQIGNKTELKSLKV